MTFTKFKKKKLKKLKEIKILLRKSYIDNCISD